ncbi:hypothetical protein ASF36_25130 [Methylobacterium sp. Leaf90]|nr:hypothetical protein ASF36_25130 [Methylobacterium sp. Leaf90]
MVAAGSGVAERRARRERHLRRLARLLPALAIAEPTPRARSTALRAFCTYALLAHDRADEGLTDTLAGIHLTACSLRTSALNRTLVLQLYLGVIVDAAGLADPAGALDGLWPHLGRAVAGFGDLEALALLTACQRLAHAVEGERPGPVLRAARDLCCQLTPNPL